MTIILQARMFNTVPRIASRPRGMPAALALTALLAAAPALRAGNLYVPNGSFESPSTSLAGPAIDSWQKAPQPPTFDPNVFGAWDNLAGVFTNTPGSPVFIDNANANQLAYLFAYPQVAIFQDYNSTDWTGSAPTHAFHAKFRPGKAYTLAVGFTSSSYEPLSAGSTLQMSLYYRDASSNRVAVAATTVTYDPTVFTNLDRLLDFQVTIPEVKPTDPWAGQYIGIQFMTTTAPNLIGGVWDLDNVRLTETVATVLNHPGWANGQFSCALQSEPGLAFQMLAATDASQPGTNWTSLATITNVTGSSSFTDTTTTQARRFYRARQSP